MEASERASTYAVYWSSSRTSRNDALEAMLGGCISNWSLDYNTSAQRKLQQENMAWQTQPICSNMTLSSSKKTSHTRQSLRDASTFQPSQECWVILSSYLMTFVLTSLRKQKQLEEKFRRLLPKHTPLFPFKCEPSSLQRVAPFLW